MATHRPFYCPSLATADITVALLVMPFLVMNDFLRKWPFGAVACHLWISCDVMCCTASILHLCAVAIDRYVHLTLTMSTVLDQSLSLRSLGQILGHHAPAALPNVGEQAPALLLHLSHLAVQRGHFIHTHLHGLVPRRECQQCV